MSKIGLVITQEYKNRVAKKSFLVLTLLMPLLFVALIFTPIWLATLKDGEMKLVAVVDQTGKYESVFTDNDAYNFELMVSLSTVYERVKNAVITKLLSLFQTI